MFNKASALFVMIGLLFIVGCAAHHHQIGAGVQGRGESVVVRQWYILWGLVPIDKVDTQTMTGGAKNYEITTAVTPVDFIISAFFLPASVQSRTVIVYR
ncbi:MAG: hypothetical protein OXI43_23360 [Candidatus Poribacteria bacterium]|nr:hypothetical protein [Candidatus Poribacteria bacterium]